MTSGPYGDASHPQEHPTIGQQAPAPGPAGYPGYPQQPYAGPPYPQPPAATGYPYPVGYGQPHPRNGMGTAGLVLGIIGVIFCWALWVGWVLNALAIIFGGVGIAQANRGHATNKGTAVAGLVLGIVGLVLGLLLWLLLGAIWSFAVGSST